MQLPPVPPRPTTATRAQPPERSDEASAGCTPGTFDTLDPLVPIKPHHLGASFSHWHDSRRPNVTRQLSGGDRHLPLLRVLKASKGRGRARPGRPSVTGASTRLHRRRRPALCRATSRTGPRFPTTSWLDLARSGPPPGVARTPAGASTGRRSAVLPAVALPCEVPSRQERASGCPRRPLPDQARNERPQALLDEARGSKCALRLSPPGVRRMAVPERRTVFISSSSSRDRMP